MPPDNHQTDTEIILPPIPHNRQGCEPASKLPIEKREQIATYVLTSGNTLKDAAREFGISRQLASAIAKEYLVDFGDIENLKLADKFHQLADGVVDELLGRDYKSTSVKQLAVLMGIAVDKKIQLAGKPQASNQDMTLRIAWQNGSGAVELKTGSGQVD